MESVGLIERLRKEYYGKKVFVTGHTGFKGSWFCSILSILGSKVKGYALAPEHDFDLYNLIKKDTNVESVFADIRDKERLEREIAEFKPDYVFHLAAQPLVLRSYSFPAETYDINVTGTANLLEGITKLTDRCDIVIVTTDKVYENRETEIYYKESDPLGGYDPYSSSKACTELLVSSFRQSFFHPEKLAKHKKTVATARAGNVIGGGDYNANRIIPDIITALQNNKPIQLRNPHAVRPWQHVLEPLTGYLHMAAHQRKSDGNYAAAYNFGPQAQDHLPVSELADTAIHYWGAGSWENLSKAEQPHEAGLLKLDISKVQKELGWQPKLKSKESIKWTIEWYKENDKAAFTQKQIINYLNL